MDYINNVVEWDYKQEDISLSHIFFNVLKDGRIHVITPNSPDLNRTPPSDDVEAGVMIKDVRISGDVSARVFVPASRAREGVKLPVVFYVHGGGFCMCSAYSVEYTRFVKNVVMTCGVVAVSVEYGLFPTRVIPACYEDSWVALKWLTSHCEQNVDQAGQDPWIKAHADLTRIFVAGDSAGGNISHTILARAGKLGLPGVAKIEGMILIHPYFDEDDKMWMYMCPTNEGPKDPRMKPTPEDLARLPCERVLVIVAEKDGLKGAGKMYVEELSKSRWEGKIVLYENLDRDHCFFMPNYLDEEALVIHQKIKSFIHLNDVDC